MLTHEAVRRRLRDFGAAASLTHREEGCRSAVTKTVTQHKHHLLVVGIAKQSNDVS